MFLPLLGGLEVGLLFTSLPHVAHVKTTIWSDTAMFTAAHAIYSQDRLLAAPSGYVPPHKERMVEFVEKHRSALQMSSDISKIVSISLLSPICPLAAASVLLLCYEYERIKMVYPLVKSFVIAGAFSTASIGIPCSFTGSRIPYGTMMAIHYLMLGSTIQADEKDVVEDASNEVYTFAVFFGTDVSKVISTACLQLAVLIALHNRDVILTFYNGVWTV